MINIKLLPKQWTVFHPVDGVDFDITLYQGGFGSGKTFLGVLGGLHTLSENHGATWVVVSDTWARLRKTTWKTYRTLLADAKVPYKKNESAKTITIPRWGNACVLFQGMEDELSLRSVNGIGAHIEEASLIGESAYNELIGRLREAPKGQTIRLWLTTNPEHTKGYLFKHFVEKAGIHKEIIEEEELFISRRRVVASSNENKHLSPAFLAVMKATYDPELYRIVVEGKDGDYTRGLVCSGFSSLNVIDTDYRSDLPIYLSCDFNVDPMSWVCAHRYNNEYHIFDEIVVENTNINECVDVFCQRYGEHQGDVIITGDASGNSRNVQNTKVGGTSYTQMQNRFQFNVFQGKVRTDVRESNPPIPDRIAAFNGVVCNTNGVRRLFVDKRCKWLIYNMNNLKYKEGTGLIDTPTVADIQKEKNKKYLGHIFDAVSYLTEKYDSIQLRTGKKHTGAIVPKAVSRKYER